jgi:hypothetical protein
MFDITGLVSVLFGLLGLYWFMEWSMKRSNRRCDSELKHVLGGENER